MCGRELMRFFLRRWWVSRSRKKEELEFPKARWRVSPARAVLGAGDMPVTPYGSLPDTGPLKGGATG